MDGRHSLPLQMRRNDEPKYHTHFYRRWCLSMVYAHPMAICKFLLVAILFYLYYLSILKWGTFNPVFTSIMTAQYEPPRPFSASPPHDWRPNSRVVFSLTTLPHRTNRINETLASLISQSISPDAIYVNIPMGTSRTGQDFVVPPYLAQLPYVKVIRPERDYGPLTKLVPALYQESDPNAIIITVDDDKIYPGDLLKTLAWRASHDDKVALSVCGWGFMPVPNQDAVMASVYVPFAMRGEYGRYVEVLQACCGNAYRRKFFNETFFEAIDPPKPPCFSADDVWISGYLETQAKVKRVVIPENLAPTDPPWLGDESSAFRLSGTNSRNYYPEKCVVYVSKHIGPWWPYK